MNYPTKAQQVILVFIIWFLSCCSTCLALDNPDTHDIVTEFKARTKKYENNIYEKAQTTSEIVLAYAEYEKFLDQELNKAYSALTKRLSGLPRKNMKTSQRRWLQYRDAEFMFINNNWTMENFGGSSRISRGAYRTAVIRDRILQLLHYLKNYGEK